MPKKPGTEQVKAKKKPGPPKRKIIIPTDVWEGFDADYIAGKPYSEVVKRYLAAGLTENAMHQRVVRNGLADKRDSMYQLCARIKVFEVAEKVAEQQLEIKAGMSLKWREMVEKLYTDFMKPKTTIKDRVQIVKGMSIAQQRIFEIYGIETKPDEGDGGGTGGNVTMNQFNINMFPAEGTEKW